MNFTVSINQQWYVHVIIIIHVACLNRTSVGSASNSKECEIRMDEQIIIRGISRNQNSALKL